MPSAVMSAPGAPKIAAEDVKLDHGKVPSSSDARVDVSTILSAGADRAARIDAAKELVDLVKIEGPRESSIQSLSMPSRRGRHGRGGVYMRATTEH